SPPRRGGVAAASKECREATEAAQTGWSDRHAIDFVELQLRLRPAGLALRATPARQLLLSCRATPPLRGGEYVPPSVVQSSLASNSPLFQRMLSAIGTVVKRDFATRDFAR